MKLGQISKWLTTFVNHFRAVRVETRAYCTRWEQIAFGQFVDNLCAKRPTDSCVSCFTNLEFESNPARASRDPFAGWDYSISHFCGVLSHLQKRVVRVETRSVSPRESGNLFLCKVMGGTRRHAVTYIGRNQCRKTITSQL